MKTIALASTFSFVAVSLLVGLATLHAPAHGQPPIHGATRTLRSLYGLPPIEQLRRGTTALLLVDFQREFFDGGLPLPTADAAARSASELLAWARAERLHVAHVANIAAKRDSPLFRFGSPGARIVDPLAPLMTEPVFTKAQGGAFTGTELETWLRAKKIDTVIIGGLMTHLAVYVSATDGATRGFRMIVARDATGSRDLPDAAGAAAVDHTSVERAALAALADRFADVMTAKQIEALPLGE